ncbi:MAG: protein translocase subunit SecF [Deltaproteobacteria bacterium]|nr:protein translocase subunit SecF [Deltaproteobacteria bacterium]
MQWIKPNINIDFMGKIRTAALASTLAVVACLVGLFVWPGPRFGVDFAGGASLQVRMKEGIDAPAIKRALTEQGYESPEVVAAADGSFLIRVRVDAPSDGARDTLATSIREALELASPAPVAAPVEPVAAPVEPVAAPVKPVAAPVEPVAAPVEPVPPPAFRTPIQGLVGALLAPRLQAQTPDVGGEPAVGTAEPTAAEPATGAEPGTEPAEPSAPPQPADAGTAAEEPADADAEATDAPPATADVVPELEATVATVEPVEAVEPVVEPEPPPEPPVVATPVAVRVDEVIVDTSGAKVDILVNRWFQPEELRDLLGSIEFEGRRMADMIGRLVPPEESVLETRNADGTYRYDIPLAQVVNLNEQDVGAVKDIVQGALAAEGLARAEEIAAIDMTLAPIALRIDSTVPLDAARLAATLDRTRYRDINLFVRCRSAICPASIDEREQVYGYQINLRGFGPDVVESLNERLGAGAVVEELSMEWVGPKVGEKLRNDGIKSVLIALGLILIYVALRFDLRFAPGAVVCLFHDAAITLGFFVFTGMEVNLTTVAAILTIVGYSINDTIVVYDRIRENLQKTQERDLVKVINTSVNETLSRTLLTSVTTILAVLAVAFFARGTIQDFAIAMIVGVVVGTYSSIYVAGPLSIVMDRKVFRRGQS